MKIKLEYENDRSKVIEYLKVSASIPTRSIDNQERYIKAVMPSCLKDDDKYLEKLRSSAHEDFIDSDDLFEYV